MARQIIKTAHEPKDIKIGDQTVAICMCGLSQNQPFCDQSHLSTQDELEDVIYIYDENDNKIGAFEMSDEDEQGGCCGGGCCSSSEERTENREEMKECCGMPGGCGRCHEMTNDELQITDKETGRGEVSSMGDSCCAKNCDDKKCCNDGCTCEDNHKKVNGCCGKKCTNMDCCGECDC
jgi:CDGSH-type Zn-finger protein